MVAAALLCSALSPLLVWLRESGTTASSGWRLLLPLVIGSLGAGAGALRRR